MKLLSVREFNGELNIHMGISLHYHNYDPVPFVILGADLARSGEPTGFYCDDSRRVYMHRSSPHETLWTRICKGRPETLLQDAHPVIGTPECVLLLGRRNYSIHDPRVLVVVSDSNPEPVAPSLKRPEIFPPGLTAKVCIAEAITSPVQLIEAYEPSSGSTHSLWMMSPGQRLSLNDHVIVCEHETVRAVRRDDPAAMLLNSSLELDGGFWL